MNRRYIIGIGIACTLLLTLIAPVESSFAQTKADWHGEYFQNANLSGVPAKTRDEKKVDFDWGSGAPFSGWPTDNWSARWTADVDFKNGLYVFSMNTKGKSRLLIDGVPLIDNWTSPSDGRMTTSIDMSKGTHQIVVEYSDNGGKAKISVLFYRFKDGGSYWQGEYYQNRDLSGSPAVEQWDTAVDMDWGKNAPFTGWDANNFSARWTRYVSFDAGKYIFSVGNDDGARLFVDGKRIINDWKDGTFRWNTVERDMTSGVHEIVVEYYERKGDARVAVDFYLAGSTPSIGPTVTAITPTKTSAPPTPVTRTATPRPTNTRVPTATRTPTPTPSLTPTLPYLAGTQSTTLIAPTLLPASLDNGIFVSDSDPKLFTWSGFPGLSFAVGGEGGQFHYVKNRESVDTVEAQWHFELQQAGYYDVFAFIPAAAEATTQYATYFVHASGRVSAPIIIDQGAYPGQWMPLGSYYFTPGYPGQFVYLDNVTGEPSASRLVLFDDVAFVPSQ